MTPHILRHETQASAGSDSGLDPGALAPRLSLQVTLCRAARTGRSRLARPANPNPPPMLANPQSARREVAANRGRPCAPAPYLEPPTPHPVRNLPQSAPPPPPPSAPCRRRPHQLRRPRHRRRRRRRGPGGRRGRRCRRCCAGPFWAGSPPPPPPPAAPAPVTSPRPRCGGDDTVTSTVTLLGLGVRGPDPSIPCMS